MYKLLKENHTSSCNRVIYVTIYRNVKRNYIYNVKSKLFLDHYYDTISKIVNYQYL